MILPGAGSGRVPVRARVRALEPGTPAFWSASVSEADQRRPSSVVAREETGRAATTLLERRRPASGPEQETASRFPREPGRQLCAVHRTAGWSIRHNCGPGTPVWRAVRGIG